MPLNALSGFCMLSLSHMHSGDEHDKKSLPPGNAAPVREDDQDPPTSSKIAKNPKPPTSPIVAPGKWSDGLPVAIRRAPRAPQELVDQPPLRIATRSALEAATGVAEEELLPDDPTEEDRPTERGEFGSVEAPGETPSETAPALEGLPIASASDAAAADEARTQEEETRRERAQKIIDEVNLDTTETMAEGDIRTQGHEMAGWHDQGWILFLRAQKKEEQQCLSELDRMDREGATDPGLRRLLRRTRTVQEKVKARVSAFSFRDKFFTEALADYQGGMTQAFGLSESAAKEKAFLLHALTHPSAVSIGDYVQFLSEERTRVAQDKTIGFFARNARALRLAHRENVARMSAGKDAEARQKHPDLVEERYESQPPVARQEREEAPSYPTPVQEAAIDLTPSTPPVERTLVEVQEEKDDAAPIVDTAPEEPRPTIVAETVEPDTQPEVPQEESLLFLPPPREIEKVAPVRADEGVIVSPPKEGGSRFSLAIEKLSRPEHRRQVFIRIFVGAEDSKSLNNMIRATFAREEILNDELRDDFAIQSLETDEVAAALADKDDQARRNIQEKVDNAIEAKEERELIQKMQARAESFVQDTVRGAENDLVKAHGELSVRLGEVKSRFDQLTQNEPDQLSFAFFLCEKIIELRLAIAEIERLGKEQAELEQKAQERHLETTPPLVATPSNINRRVPKPSTPPQPTSLLGPWGKRLALALPLLFAPNHTSQESHPSAPVTVGHASEEIFNRSVSDAGEEESIFDEGASQDNGPEPDYVTGHLEKGGTVWHAAEDVLRDVGILDARQKEIVFLTRIILDANKISHPHDLRPGQAVDLTRATHLAEEMKAGADVDELWHALGYEGEVRL